LEFLIYFAIPQRLTPSPKYQIQGKTKRSQTTVNKEKNRIAIETQNDQLFLACGVVLMQTSSMR